MNSEIFPRGKRIRKYRIDPQILPGLFKTGVFNEIINGIPEGAQFRGYAIDHVTNNLVIFVEHESFEMIHEGGESPTHTIVAQTYFGKDLHVMKRFIKEAMTSGT